MAFRLMNDKSLNRAGRYGTVLVASRADFSGGASVMRPVGITDEHYASDLLEIAAWHALRVHPYLKGFSGYDSVCVKTADTHRWQCRAAGCYGDCGYWNMVGTLKCGKCGAPATR